MPRNNTGNPLPSSSPLDREDNSLILEELINSKDKDSVPDRFGLPLRTWHKIEQGIEEQLIAGGKIFPSEPAGRAAAENGQYFFAESDDPDVSKSLYQRVSESESRWIADDPSVEFVRSAVDASTSALDLASQPGLLSGEFYADDDEQPIYSITDEDGNALAAWNRQGELDAEPSQALSDKVQRVRGEFHVSDDDQPSYALTDEAGRLLYAVDENGQPIVPFIGEFHTEDGQPSYAWTDRNGVIFYGIDEEGRNAVGGGEASGFDVESLPRDAIGIGFPEAYLDRDVVKAAPDWVEFYSSGTNDSVRPHTTLYDNFDLLIDEFPEYVSREELGRSMDDSPIYSYTFEPPAKQAIGFHDGDYPPVEVCIIGGIHGTEGAAMLTNLTFAHELCRQWNHDEIYSELRFACRLRILPTTNPHGCDTGLRRNVNGVDLNRNFPTGWDDATGDKGSAPLSESEAAVIASLPATYPNCIGFIDHHNHAISSISQWIGVERPEDVGMANEVMRRLYREQVVVAGDDELDLLPARLTGTDNGTCANHLQHEYDVTAFLMETSFSGWAPLARRRRFQVECLKRLVFEIYKREINKRINNGYGES